MKRLTALILALGITLAAAPANATGGLPQEKKDDLHVKTYINSSFGSVLDRYKGEYSYTGYDMNQAGGTLNAGPGLNMTDSSSYLPVGTERKFESITYGNVVWKFPIQVDAKMEGLTLSLRNGEAPVVQLQFGKEKIYYVGAGGQTYELMEYKTNTNYYVNVSLDFDEKKVKGIYIDGKLRCAGADFTNPLSADNLQIRSGDVSTGTFHISSMFLARGYEIHEEFGHTGGNAPDDWQLVSNPEKTSFSGMAYFEEQQEDVIFSKKIEPVSGREITEFQILVPEERGGVKVALLGDGEEIISVGADSGSLVCNGEPFYEYMPTVWYHFKIDADLENGTANIKLNGIDRLQDVKLSDIKSLDEIRLTITGEGQGDVGFDNVWMYPYEEFDDYVPEPQKVESDGIDIGMQYCNMWSEGYHFGWDYTARSPGRRSLAGYYDEAYYESVDWEIKWMVEHGIDFIWDCWYMGGATDIPYQDTNMLSPFHTSNGFFDAKYRDQIKFCLMWENTVNNDQWNGTPEENCERFLNYLAPFWIEYYFKDPSYYKPGGRPLISIYWAWYNPFGEGRAQMFEEFKQMCIDAGVGEPLIFQQMNLEAQTLDLYRSMPGSGFDGTYNYANSPLPEDCVYSNKTRLEMIKEWDLPLKFIPTISQGFETYTWGLDGGICLNDPEDFRRSIQLVKEQVLPQVEPIGENKVLMFGSWNEYHEGHYIAPTEDHGFALLDVIREEFAGGGEHEDVVPTQAQKDRISNWYPENRELPLLERNLPLSVPEDAKVLSSWEFEDGTDGFEAVGAKSFTAEDGALCITGNGENVVLTAEKLNIPFQHATHLELVIDNSENAVYSAEASYKTDVVNEYHAHHGHDFYIKTDQTDEFTRVIPIGKRVDWVKGNMTALRITLSSVLDNKTIKIKGITLYGEETEGPKENEIILSAGGYKQNVAAIMKEKRPMVPLRTAVEALGGKTYYDEMEDKIRVKINGSVYTVLPGEPYYLLDNVRQTMNEYALLEDGMTYVSLDFLSVLADKDIKWNVATRELSIEDYSDFVLTRPNTDRTLVRSWEFDADGDQMGWGTGGWLYDVDSWDVSDGTYNMTYTTGNPIIFSDYLSGIDTQDVKLISIGIQSNAAYGAKIYFTTSADGTFKEQMAYSFNVGASSDVVEYTINTADCDRWTDELTRLRMDMGSNLSNTIRLDYVRLYGDFEGEVSEEELANRYNSITQYEDKTAWEFEVNNTKDGWIFNRDGVDIQTEKGWLSWRMLTPQAAMYTAGQIQMPAESVRNIEFRMKNQTSGTQAKLYFITDEDDTWDEAKSYAISTYPLDGVGTVYTVDTASNELWAGTVTGLKIVPSDETGEISFDYVYLKN